VKMTTRDQEDLQRLVESVRSSIGETRLAIHYAGLANDPRVNSRDDRFRWDVWYAVPQSERFAFMDRAYAYLNDSHILTALRKYVPIPTAS
jgi:hypothetical protein